MNTPKLTWCIEDFVSDNYYQDLIDEVKNQGHECCVIRYAPFQSGDYNKVCSDVDCVIFQGSINLAEQLQKEKPNWCPGVIATWSSYECNLYYQYFEEYLLNQDFEYITVEEFGNNRWDIYRKHGKEALIWARPSSGKKTFKASTIDLEEFDKVYNNWIVPYTNPNDVVVVSSPKTINGEWRFICCEQRIVGVSSYLYQGNRIYIPSAPAGATQLCQHILDSTTWRPDQFFALDICETIDGKFWMLELNAFSSCGLYKANKQNIVKEVSQYAKQKFMAA